MDGAPRPAWVPTFLGCSMLLGMAALLAWAPFVRCPVCSGQGSTEFILIETGGVLGRTESVVPVLCQGCKGKRKLTFYRRWTDRAALQEWRRRADDAARLKLER